jgi:hypothetical protein
MDESRLYAVHSAAGRGSIFVKKELLTMDQLETALGEVAAGANFDTVLLEKQWITEREIECVDQCLADPDKPPNGDAKQIAHVVLNRLTAQHRETRSVVGEITRIASVIQEKATAMPRTARRDSGEFCCEP